jgi:hypothetical protein
MAQAESSIGASSIDLICTDYFWVVTMTAAIGPCLGFQVFSFVVGIKAESIEKCKAFTCHRDENLRSKLNIAPCLATQDRPDMGLTKGVNTGQITPEMTKLLSDRLTDFDDSRPLLLSHG